jgi:hypothetical protein
MEGKDRDYSQNDDNIAQACIYQYVYVRPSVVLSKKNSIIKMCNIKDKEKLHREPKLYLTKQHT